MKMENLPESTPPSAAATTSPEVFQQLGEMTRNLHDTLAQLGFMPKLGEINPVLEPCTTCRRAC